ncbi:21514_t:CDS:2, partial [Entrophospora sp. SA101]
MAAITQNITTPAPVTSVVILLTTTATKLATTMTLISTTSITIGSDPKSDLVISNSNPAEPVIAKTHCWLELNLRRRQIDGASPAIFVEGRRQDFKKTGDDSYDDCDNKIETMLLIKKKNILFTNKLINSKNPILKQEELKNYKDELKLIKSVDCGRVLSLADQHFDDDSVVQVHFQKRAIQYNIRPLQYKKTLEIREQLYKEFIWRLIKSNLPLAKNDFEKGVIECLGQLSVIGNPSKEQFIEHFNQMKSSKGYYIIVIENEEEKIVGVGTLLVELKFLRSCGK